MNLRQDLNNILNLYKEKNEILRKFLDISIEIKVEIDRNTDQSANIVHSLADKRQFYIEKLKNTDLAINHYSIKLPVREREIINEINEASKNGVSFSNIANFSDLNEINGLNEFSELYELFKNNKAVLNSIKLTDENNSAIIIRQMKEIKNKIESIKANRTLMNKFVGDKNVYSSGTLMNEKK